MKRVRERLLSSLTMFIPVVFYRPIQTQLSKTNGLVIRKIGYRFGTLSGFIFVERLEVVAIL